MGNFDRNSDLKIKKLPISLLRGLKFLATKISDERSTKEELEIEVELYLKDPFYLSKILINLALLVDSLSE